MRFSYLGDIIRHASLIVALVGLMTYEVALYVLDSLKSFGLCLEYGAC